MHRTLFILLFGLIITAMPAMSFAQSEDTPIAGAGAVYCPQLSQTMVRGARDRTTIPPGQVTELQRFISDYYDIDPDDIVTGYFGTLTHRNVVRFQQEQGLPAFGIVGPLTRAAIAHTCGNGLSNPPEPAMPLSCTFNGQTIADGASITAYASSTVAYGGQCKSETRTCIKGVLTGSYQQPSCSVSNPNPAENNNCSFNGQTIPNGSSVVAYQASSALPGSSCVSERRYCILGTLTGSYGYATCTVGSNFTEPPRSCTQDGVTVAHGASRTFYNTRTVNSAGACTAASELRACNDGMLSGSFPYASCTPLGSASLPPVLFFSSKDANVVPGNQTTLTWVSTTNATWCSASGGWSGTKATSGTEATAALWQTTTFSLTCFGSSGTWATKSVTVSVIPEEPAQKRSCIQDGVTVAHGASRVFYNTRTVNSAGACTAASEMRACNDGTLSGSYPYASCTTPTNQNPPPESIGTPPGYAQTCQFNGQTIADGASITAYAFSAVPAGGQCKSETRTCFKGVLTGSYGYATCTVGTTPQTGPLTDANCEPLVEGGGISIRPTTGPAPLAVILSWNVFSPNQWNGFDFGDGTKLDPMWGSPLVHVGTNYNMCTRHTYVTPGTYTIKHTWNGVPLTCNSYTCKTVSVY